MAEKQKSKIEEKYLSKDSNTKFSEDEMGKLTEVRDKYLDIQHQFGQSAIMKLRLEEKISDLNNLMD